MSVPTHVEEATGLSRRAQLQHLAFSFGGLLFPSEMVVETRPALSFSEIKKKMIPTIYCCYSQFLAPFL
jgi:hypothetical protein